MDLGASRYFSTHLYMRVQCERVQTHSALEGHTALACTPVVQKRVSTHLYMRA